EGNRRDEELRAQAVRIFPDQLLRLLLVRDGRHLAHAAPGRHRQCAVRNRLPAPDLALPDRQSRGAAEPAVAGGACESDEPERGQVIQYTGLNGSGRPYATQNCRVTRSGSATTLLGRLKIIVRRSRVS